MPGAKVFSFTRMQSVFIRQPRASWLTGSKSAQRRNVFLELYFKGKRVRCQHSTMSEQTATAMILFAFNGRVSAFHISSNEMN